MDTILHALSQSGALRFTAISGKELVEEARRIHNLSRVCTAALGRQLLVTAIMAAGLKAETDSLTTIIKGDGPAGSLVCTGRYGALVKGYIANPEVELPLTPNGKLDVGAAVGRRGKLTVIRDLSLREPYVGECNLISGEIAEDFAQYYTASEQTPSLVYLGVRMRPDTGEVLAAGGLVAQPLPDCPDEEIDLLQNQAQEIANLTRYLEQGLSLDAALQKALGDQLPITVAGTAMPSWSCDCSRSRTERALIALGRDELTDMIQQDGGAELLCHFCNKKYVFSADDLSALLQESSGSTIDEETLDAKREDQNQSENHPL